MAKVTDTARTLTLIAALERLETLKREETGNRSSSRRNRPTDRQTDVLVTCPSRNETETGPWQIAHEAQSPENTVK
ncbi:hypothetical protein ACLKA6_011294 [Drosophila palustris]